MFDDIAWSTERVAAQTLERAREINLEVYSLPAWYDIDDSDDLRRLNAELSGESAMPGPRYLFAALSIADGKAFETAVAGSGSRSS